jgi:hypothetical protein
MTGYWFPLCDHCDVDATAATIAENGTPAWRCDRHRQALDTALTAIRAGHVPTDHPAWKTIAHHCQGTRKPLIRTDVPPDTWRQYLDAGWTPQPPENPTYATPPTHQPAGARKLALVTVPPTLTPGVWSDGTPIPDEPAEEFE